MIVIYVVREDSGAIIGGTLLNMAVFGAVISYFMQGLSFVVLRQKLPHIPRPYVSPLGNAGGYIVMIIAAVTLVMQLQDPVYRNGVYFAAAWYAICVIYFAADRPAQAGLLAGRRVRDQGTAEGGHDQGQRLIRANRTIASAAAPRAPPFS